MAGTAERTDPRLWDEVKAEITHGGKGGQPGQWSARKAQLAVREYKQRGGGYKGVKASDNHLVQWTREAWDTKSGQPSGKTHERYLPKKAREKLSDTDYKRTTAKKRADLASGRQFSQQPADVGKKVASARAVSPSAVFKDTVPERRTKTALMTEARKRDVSGRSRMSHDELAKALRQ